MNNKRFTLVTEARALGNRRGEIMIYSAISDWGGFDEDPNVTSRAFDRQLKDLGDVDEITVRINSPGGVVSEAVAIRAALIKHPASKTIDIEGSCDSAATLIACLPGARVRMAKGADYMIHCCSCIAAGNQDKMRSILSSLENTDRDMADIYAERTGKTAEDCLALMRSETWYGAEDAVREGFADEIISSADTEESIVACAMDADAVNLMRTLYAHAPLRPDARANNHVSTEKSAVAAGFSAENTNNEGVERMIELRDATAEQLRQENPQLAQSIAQQAIEAERKRAADIDKLTPRGAKYQAMAKKAKAEGASAAEFLEMVITEQGKEGAEYLENRRVETAAADRIGAGDSHDADDDPGAMMDKAAADVANIARTMTVSAGAMA